MIPRNITRITASLLKNSPYTYEVLWSKSNYVLVELVQKLPPPGKIPDYYMKSQYYLNDVKELFEIQEIPDPTREEKVASLNEKGYF